MQREEKAAGHCTQAKIPCKLQPLLFICFDVFFICFIYSYLFLSSFLFLFAGHCTQATMPCKLQSAKTTFFLIFFIFSTFSTFFTLFNLFIFFIFFCRPLHPSYNALQIAISQNYSEQRIRIKQGSAQNIKKNILDKSENVPNLKICLCCNSQVFLAKKSHIFVGVGPDDNIIRWRVLLGP